MTSKYIAISGHASMEFKTFLERNGIRQTLVPPYHPASNGLAERAVQTVKSGLAKMDGNIDEQLHRFLFRYRLTPHSTTGLLPAELLLGRKLRCSLNQVYPETSNRVLESQEKMVGYGSKAKPQDPRLFKVRDKILVRMFRGHGKWAPAEVNPCGRKADLRSERPEWPNFNSSCKSPSCSTRV